MRKIALFLIVALLAGMLAGCVSQQPPQEEAGPAETNGEEQAGGPPTDIHEVYSLIETTIMFDGLRPPYYESRAHIPKGLPKTKDDEVYIGFPISRMTSEAFVNLIDAVEERCEKYGYKFEFTDASGSLEKQRADMEAFVTKGVDAIIVNPIDPLSMEMDVARAVEKGVIVVGCGIAFYPSAGVLTCVWADNYNGGFEQGRVTAKAFTNQPIKLGMIIGRFGTSMCESKGNGFVGGLLYERFAQMGKPFASKEDAMLEGYKVFSEFRDKGKISYPEADLDIVMGVEGQLTYDTAMKVTEDMLTAHPDINLIYCESDDMGEGVVKALESRGIEFGNDKDLKLSFGGGGNEITMNLIREDKLLCTVHGNPMQNGYVMVDLIHDVLENDFDANDLTITTFAPIVVLTKENLDEYYIPGEFYPKPIDFGPISIEEWNARGGQQ